MNDQQPFLEYAAPQRQRYSGQAIASFTCTCVAIAAFFVLLAMSIVPDRYLNWGTGLAMAFLSLLIMLIGAVVSLILGLLALAYTSRKQIRPLRGRWMAVVGIIYGAIFLLMMCILVIPIFRTPR